MTEWPKCQMCGGRATHECKNARGGWNYWCRDCQNRISKESGGRNGWKNVRGPITWRAIRPGRNKPTGTKNLPRSERPPTYKKNGDLWQKDSTGKVYEWQGDLWWPVDYGKRPGT